MVGRGGDGAKLKSETYCTAILESYRKIDYHDPECAVRSVRDQSAGYRAGKCERRRLRDIGADVQHGKWRGWQRTGRRHRSLGLSYRVRDVHTTSSSRPVTK